MTDIVDSIPDLVARLDHARAEGKRVGVVPTMGALHTGHLALVDEVRNAGANFVVLTVFVNPLQFNDAKDLDAYPRTLDEDARAAATRGVDLVFAPSPGSMYPPGHQTSVDVHDLTRRWEGEHRPGHFRGVTTVVTKRLALTAPAVAIFGRKDYQQWVVLRRMVEDLNLRIEMRAMDTVRESDGLALSSRNGRLAPTDRVRATAIARAMRAAQRRFADGERRRVVLEGVVRDSLNGDVDAIDYVACVDPETLEPASDGSVTMQLLVAVHVGGVRLIDNMRLVSTP
ncbi:MAG: pantoate--beta-alanine ligase [Polyangiales bacterium]